MITVIKERVIEVEDGILTFEAIVRDGEVTEITPLEDDRADTTTDRLKLYQELLVEVLEAIEQTK